MAFNVALLSVEYAAWQWYDEADVPALLASTEQRSKPESFCDPQGPLLTVEVRCLKELPMPNSLHRSIDL